MNQDLSQRDDENCSMMDEGTEKADDDEVMGDREADTPPIPPPPFQQSPVMAEQAGQSPSRPPAPPIPGTPSSRTPCMPFSPPITEAWKPYEGRVGRCPRYGPKRDDRGQVARSNQSL